MAPTTLSCDSNGCGFTTAEFEPAVAVELLKMHHQNHHALVQQPPQVGGQTVSVKPRAEKVPRPKIKLGVSQDEFLYFQDEWTS